MNFRRLDVYDLADFAVNLKTLLAGTELDSLDPAIRAELLAELGTLPEQLADETMAAMVLEERRMAAISARNETRARIRAVAARVRDSLKAAIATQGEYDRCGFDHNTTRSRYVAQDPTGLSAQWVANGVNRLKFSGNNRAAQVVYEIWRREPDGDEWRLLGMTRRQTFDDTGVTAGTRYRYKVRAAGTRTISNFSNEAIVGEPVLIARPATRINIAMPSRNGLNGTSPAGLANSSPPPQSDTGGP